MTGGRTIWLAQDAQRHRRALMIELKQEHGAVAIACDTVICSKAKLQGNERGVIRDGFASIAEEAGCGRDEVRAFVAHAAKIGWLDDLEVDEDGRRFNVRVSGWHVDQDKAYAAWRKRGLRSGGKNGDMSPNDDPNGDQSPPGTSVPECPTTGQDRTGQEVTTSAEVRQVFDAWVAATKRDAARTKLTPDRRRRIEKALTSHGLNDCMAAVEHIGADAWAGGQNERQRPFNDIEHALGNSERIERWRDQQPRVASIADHASTRARRAAALQRQLEASEAEGAA